MSQVTLSIELIALPYTFVVLTKPSRRGDSAPALCDGITQSVSLITLNLAWNGLGEANGCRAIHDALKWSSILKFFDLSENRVAYEGACLLAQVWIHPSPFVMPPRAA